MSENKEKYSYLQKQWNEFQTDIDVEKLKDINENFNEYIVSIKDNRLELTAYKYLPKINFKPLKISIRG